MINLKRISESKVWAKVFFGIITAIVVMAIFQAGVFVGFHKARFSYQWGDSYRRTFGGPRGGMMQNIKGQEFTSGHGTSGSIVSIDGGKIIVKDQEGTEKFIVTDDQTTIRSGRQDIKITDLKAGQNIVVIGTPNEDGTIRAQVIRTFGENDFRMMQRPESNINIQN